MKKKLVAMVMSLVMVATVLTGCGKEADSDKKILRVGMECAYAPFNWTQSSSSLSDGSVAVPIYGTNDYAYGYDVMVAKMLAENIGYELEVHKGRGR